MAKLSGASEMIAGAVRDAGLPDALAPAEQLELEMEMPAPRALADGGEVYELILAGEQPRNAVTLAKLSGASEMIAGAVRDAGLPDALAPAEQLELEMEMPAPRALADGGEVYELILAGEQPRNAVTLARRGGRPKGSRNRRSRELADYLVRRYGHPLEMLAATVARPAAALAAELNTTAAKAFELQQRAAAELAPYVESRMPVALAVDSRTIQLVIHEGAGAPAQAGADGEGDRDEGQTLTIAPVAELDRAG